MLNLPKSPSTTRKRKAKLHVKAKGQSVASWSTLLDLEMAREKSLDEIVVAELKESGIKPPKAPSRTLD